MTPYSLSDSRIALGDIVGMPLEELSEAGILTAVNDAYCALLRRSREDLIGHNPAEFTHPDDAAATATQLASMLTEPHTSVQFEKRYVRGDGSIVWARVTGAWLESRRVLMGLVVDISEMVEAREAAGLAQRRLSALVHHSEDLIFLVDANGKLLDANPATIRVIGDRIGDRARDILADRVHPDDVASMRGALAAVYSRPGPHARSTFRLTSISGDELSMEAVANNQLDNPAVRGIVLNVRDVSERVRHLEQTEANQRALIEALGRTAEFRDPYTGGHQRRVAELAVLIAETMGMSSHRIDGVRLGALIHDIGKVAIPAELLSFPGPLSEAAFQLIKTHSQIGRDIVAGIGFPWPISEIILQHHERLDGSGYPKGLRGDSICLEAQIVAVADVSEAITSHRPYRPALGADVAMAELRRGRGRLYNPGAVDACAALVKDGRFELATYHGRWNPTPATPPPTAPVTPPPGLAGAGPADRC